MSACGMKQEVAHKEKISNTSPDILLVVNPSSSSGLTGKGWKVLFKKIKEDFGETPLEVVFTKGPGDGTTLTRELLKKGFRKVVAIGGDGIINEVANGFFFKEEQNLKSGKVTSSNGQDRPQDNNIEPAILRPHSKTITKVFLNAAEIGFGAEIIDRSKKVRSKINSRDISTIANVATSLPAYESNLCEVIVDDGREKILTKM
ncbi:MAG TPA: diacylglycerol kinase family protein, partial [Candidatus Nitrosopolaris sp.]